MTLVAAFLAVSLQTPTVQLYRGAELPGQALRYWAVEDTVLDAGNPDGNFGGASYLIGGNGKVLLIKFGDLRRALGSDKVIKKASILFTVSGGNPAPLGRAAEVRVPWGEGPAQVVGYGSSAPTVGAPAWSASWRHRRAGENAISWQQPGAAGVGDAKQIDAAKSTTPDNDHVRITGLESAVQRMYDRPYDNHGFLFAFDGPVEFSSSQGRSGRPVLELEIESRPAPTGPDLAVVRIVRTPEYPRLPSAEPHRAAQDGVEVPVPNAPDGKAKHWPANGEEVVYSAVIKNLGDAPATGFEARWIQRERMGSAVEFSRTLAPGEETLLPFRSNYRTVPNDHRLLTLGLRIEPKGPDAEPANNGLTIHENALTVGFRFAGGAAQAIAQSRPLGARTPDEWAQAVVSLWNETIFPQSRFSFAPDGVLERLSLQKVEVGEGELNDSLLDVNVTVGPGAVIADRAWNTALLRDMGRQLGLADLGSMNFTGDANPGSIRVAGESVERYPADLYPGIMGGGDTRFDGFVPALLNPPYEPTVNPIFDALPMEATDLLSSTDVAALNTTIGQRRGFAPEGLYGLPPSVLIKIVDQAGLPVGNATVEVYALADGKFQGETPIAKLQTSPQGTVALPNRPTQLPAGHTFLSGKSLGANPFGRLDPNGTNGVLLLRVSTAGVTDYAYVKAWQLSDTYRRSASPVVVFDLRVNTGGDVDKSQNLAKNRIITDSASSLPAKLAALVDDAPASTAQLLGGKDAWVEIDLGRDRPFGEVRLVTNAQFWEKFTVMAYATGQTISEAKVIAREAFWPWMFANRSDREEGNAMRSVGYRTAGVRARYIRIVRTSDGGPGTLAEIRVHPLKPQG